MLSRLKKERTKLREIELKQDKETRNTIENLYFDLKKRLQGLESEELTYVERIKLAKEIKSVVNHVNKMVVVFAANLHVKSGLHGCG